MIANEFEMSVIGELSYFLGLQIKQLKNNTFVSQRKCREAQQQSDSTLNNKAHRCPPSFHKILPTKRGHLR